MAENIVQGFRQVVQDLLVPELKAVQVELKHVQETVSFQGEELKALRQEMNERFESVMEEIADLKRTDTLILGRLDNLLERVNWTDTIRELHVGLQRVADKVGVEL